MVNEQPIKVTLYSDEDKELHRIEEENSKSDVRVNFGDIEDTLEISDMPVENITVRNYNVSDDERVIIIFIIHLLFMLLIKRIDSNINDRGNDRSGLWSWL